MAHDYVGKIDPVYGLGLLVDSAKGLWGDIDKNSVHRKEFKKHPFGLDIPASAEGGFDLPYRMFLFHTGGTVTSVNAMMAHINHAIADSGIEEMRLKRLRIINVQDNAAYPDHHHVFFEVWTSSRVYICGDCTDCSGTGGHGNKQMRSIFSLLNLVYHVNIEEVEIPHSKVYSWGKARRLEVGLNPR